MSPLCVCSDGFLYTNGSYLSILYFIVVTIIGTYIIMTLFIVILLERFAGQDDSTWALHSSRTHTHKHCKGFLGRCSVADITRFCTSSISHSPVAPVPLAGKFELEDMTVRVRASLPHGALEPASRDAIVMELAREKTQMDRNRKLAKIKELMKREEEEEVGMLSCGHAVMWACCHVGMLSCGQQLHHPPVRRLIPCLFARICANRFVYFAP